MVGEWSHGSVQKCRSFTFSLVRKVYEYYAHCVRISWRDEWVESAMVIGRAVHVLFDIAVPLSFICFLASEVVQRVVFGTMVDYVLATFCAICRPSSFPLALEIIGAYGGVYTLKNVVGLLHGLPVSYDSILKS